MKVHEIRLHDHQGFENSKKFNLTRRLAGFEIFMTIFVIFRDNS